MGTCIDIRVVGQPFEQATLVSFAAAMIDVIRACDGGAVAARSRPTTTPPVNPSNSSTKQKADERSAVLFLERLFRGKAVIRP